MHKITFGITLLLQLVFLSAFSQPLDTLRQLDLIFFRGSNVLPGASVLVARGDHILYHKAFGLADLEHNVPNTPTTIFEGGSLAKQFTATALLLLAAEGKVSLDDDVRKYVPELPDYGETIRIQHLLNHTSGLKDWGSVGALTGWPRTTRIYTQELALQIICRQNTLNFAPGAEYSYSNANYTLLVTVVERISGQSLAEFTRLRLFEPLGMSQTQWRNNFRQVLPNRAVAYQKNREGVYEQLMPFENIYGHGGILTTTGDLLKWNRQLERHQIGGEKVYQWRVKQGVLNNGRKITYASALVVDKRNGFEEISHSGSTAGYRGWLAWYPEKKITIAILSNDGTLDVVRSGREVADIYLGKLPASAPQPTFIKPDSISQQRYKGIYRSIRNFDAFTLEVKGEKATIDGKVLQSLHKDTLYLNGVRWAFVKPGSLCVINGIDTSSYQRVNPPQIEAASLKKLVGEYFSKEADVTFKVVLKGSDLWIENPPHPSYKLTPAFQNGFYSGDMDLYEFKETKPGNIYLIEVSTSRAERIMFVKPYRKK